jgi:hypothetical protein
LGTPQAITATAHKLARLIYTMLKHGTADVRQSLADYEQHDRDRMVQSLMRRVKALGYALVPTPAGTPMSLSRLRNSSLEGSRWSRDHRAPVADCVCFAAWRGAGDVGGRSRGLT